MFVASMLAWYVDWRLTVTGRQYGLAGSLAILFSAAALLCFRLWTFLPAVPVTGYRLHAQTAEVAYAKNVFVYFLPMVVVVGIVPFHVVARLQHELSGGDHQSVKGFLRGQSKALKLLYVRPRYLWAGLVCAALYSVGTTNRLFDNLLEGPYTNLFMMLALARLLVYYALAVACLVWYSKTLTVLEEYGGTPNG